MNKEQAKERLCAIESEVEKLRRIIDEPEARMPEAGDVWKLKRGGWDVMLGSGDVNINLLNNGQMGLYTHTDFTKNGATYLGKFDEVFVKISDVREALSIKDDRSRNVIEWLADDRFKPRNQTIIETHSALRKLNIITD